jgi:hypothetical protein
MDVTTPPYEIMPDRVSVLENHIRELRVRLKWMMVFWWLLFVLLIIGAFGISALHIWDVRQLRKEGTDGWSLTTKRVDDMRKASDEAIDSRTTPLGQRADLIWQQLSQMQQQIGALQAKADQCSQSCVPPGIK